MCTCRLFAPPWLPERATIMTAFNTLNGVPATGNPFLLRQILRGEWKFNGLVVSDYEAITEMVPHGYRGRPAAMPRAKPWPPASIWKW